MTKKELLDANIDELRDLLLSELIKATDNKTLKKCFHNMVDYWAENKVGNFDKAKFFIEEDTYNQQVSNIKEVADVLKSEYNSFVGAMIFDR